MSGKANLWLTVSQTASYLNVCPYTVRKLIKKNKLRANKSVTGDWRVDALFLANELDRTSNIHSRRPQDEAIVS